MSAPAIKPTVAAPVELDLDARLAVAGAFISSRLDEAAVAFEVRTAHIPTEPLQLGTIVSQPIATPAPALAPYTTPLAALLHRARTRLEAGWCTGRLRDEQGAVCAIGAIRAEADSRSQADDACGLLLDRIRSEFADVQTIPAWQDQQRSVEPVLRIFDGATRLADRRGV